MIHATHSFDALMEITARPPVVFVRGEGSYLWDDAGKRYLDFIQGWAVNCLGHSPPALAEAISVQARQLITPSPAYYNDTSLKLAKALTDLCCFDRCSSPIPAPKPTKARSSSHGNMAPSTKMARTRSSPSKGFSRPDAGDDVRLRQGGV